MGLMHRLSRLIAPADESVLRDIVEPPAAPDPIPAFRRTVAESVILQDEAEAVLRGIRARESLGVIAPRGGPLIRRFFALRDQLPVDVEGEDQLRLRAELAAILYHHAMALSVAMDFLACEWRSPALARQVDSLTDLGSPARRLEEIYAGLRASVATGP